MVKSIFTDGTSAAAAGADSVVQDHVWQGHWGSNSPDIPVPMISDVVGWGVKDSIKLLARKARAMIDHRKQCQELLAVLEDSGLHACACALDQLTDLQQDQAIRDEYTKLCSALEDSEVLLLHPSATTDCVLQPCSFLIQLPYLLLHGDKPTQLRRLLKTYCSLQKCTQLKVALESVPPMQVPRINPADQHNPLQQRYIQSEDGPPRSGLPHMPEFMADVFDSHGVQLVVRVDDLQQSGARNIGLVGTGGVGKTTIARAAYERAKARFDAAIWLNSSSSEADILSRLRSAWSELVGDQTAAPFETVQEGVTCMTRHLYSRNKSVLLVLDNVSPSSDMSSLATLNFATARLMRVEGSRLIVTTRTQNSLTCAPGVDGTGQEDDEFVILKLDCLAEEQAKQLFYYHAFGSPAALLPDSVPLDACSALITSCRGHPLAIEVLACEAKHYTEPVQWERRQAAQAGSHGSIHNSVTHTCQTSVQALPPSLIECFIDFAAFRGDAEIREQHLVHLMATHAPLQSPDTLKAAHIKLQQLVSRSLISKFHFPHSVEPMYKMSDIMRQLAQDPARRCSFSADDGQSSFEALQYLSTQGSPPSSKLADRPSNSLQGLRGCVAWQDGQADEFEWPSTPRLRYLWLEGQIDVQVGGVMQWSMLKFLRLGRSALGCLEAILQHARELEYLELSVCADLTELPACLTDCYQLRYLHLPSCNALTTLPSDIGDCVNLRHIDMENCGSLTHLPDSITRCEELQYLSVRACKIPALPDRIGDCKQLEVLDAGHCEYLTELPQSIMNCVQLKHIDLSRCSGLTRLPDDMGRWVRLERLNIRFCTSLTGLPASISGCQELRHVYANWCRGLGDVSGLGACTKLMFLDLRGCDEIQEIPAGICQCRWLKHLDLSRCVGIKSFPGGAGEWAWGQLVHLDLSGMGVRSLHILPEGLLASPSLTYLAFEKWLSLEELPDSICRASQLGCLNLSNCISLTHTPELGTFSDLKDLLLNFCSGLRSLPQSIGSCTQLTRLSLYQCTKLEGLPDGIEGCSQLQEVNLAECIQLLGLPEGIRGCVRLRDLDLSRCFKLTTLPEGIGGCIQLTSLQMSECTGLESLPDGIGGCIRLQMLKLNGCSSLRDLPARLGMCTSLQHLLLKACSSLERLPEEVSGCSRLRTLDLQECPNFMSLPDGIQHCTNLGALALSECARVTELPSGIRGCSELTQLMLYKCSSLKQLPEHIKGCVKLVRLDMRQCTSLIQLPDALGHCARLQSLSLQACSSLTSLPDGIGSCAQLTVLDLPRCSSLTRLPDVFSGCNSLRFLLMNGCSQITELPESICECTRLRKVNLVGCSNLMCLPEGMGAWEQLQELDLGQCSHLAWIPDSIGSCQELGKLTLQGCSRLESLPASISSCLKLKQLDIRECSNLNNLVAVLSSCLHLTRLLVSEDVDLSDVPEGIREVAQIAPLSSNPSAAGSLVVGRSSEALLDEQIQAVLARLREARNGQR